MSTSTRSQEPSRSVGQFLSLLCAGALCLGATTFIWAGEAMTPQGALRELRGFREMGSVLYVAAHPDDENTQLIASFARGKGYRTAYLSLTRGDGGQNVIGPELFEELGVIRTQELLAARRLDGGRQFFTRAIDFGYSKSPEETLRIWDRKSVVADIVRIIRTFRPDVVITRFSPQGGGHGHHTASAILAIEAFRLAGDPKAFPEQAVVPGVWQPKRLLQDGGGFGRGGGGGANALKIEIEGNDPVTGESLGTIAGRSRSMHRSQGFGGFGGGPGGGGGSGGPRTFSFTLLAGEPAKQDIFEGVDTTWARLPHGAEVAKLADEAIAKFDLKNPAASVPALLALRSRVIQVHDDPPGSRILAEKIQQLDRAIRGCLGLVVETSIPHAEVVPGEVLALHHTATIKADFPVRWLGVTYEDHAHTDDRVIEMHPGQTAVRDVKQTLPPARTPSQPYWLLQDHSVGMFKLRDDWWIEHPENGPAFSSLHAFQVGNDRFDLRLMSWGDGSGVPTSGKYLIVVGTDQNGLLHIRTFDTAGNRFTDTDETQLPDRALAIAILKQQLPNLLPPHVLTDAEKARVLEQATSIVDQTCKYDILDFYDVPMQAATASEPARRIDVIAPVSLKFEPEVRLFAPGSKRDVKVEVTAARDNQAGPLEVLVPAGWNVEPVGRPFRLAKAGDRETFAFTVKAPAEPATAVLTAQARIDNPHHGWDTWNTQRVVIKHEHIPVQLLQPPARLKTVALDLAIKGKRVGYVPGAGDRTAEALAEMGYEVTKLAGADFTPEKLGGLDAVVIGVRAFNVRDDLAGHMKDLFNYVEDGGTVVAQYNRPNGLRTNELAPYDLKLSDSRVTDEDAPVTFLAPDHPVLNTPNKITLADFEGWVQERGIYYPTQWDKHFTPILAAGDPGEPPLKGGLLVAKHGKGYFVYTGLVFFRELPAGVPGAYRLFANLVSLGQ